MGQGLLKLDSGAWVRADAVQAIIVAERTHRRSGVGTSIPLTWPTVLVVLATGKLIEDYACQPWASARARADELAAEVAATLDQEFWKNSRTIVADGISYRVAESAAHENPNPPEETEKTVL